MAINKLNMEELKDGIDSLELWHDIHEEILEKLGTVKEKIEENEGSSIDQALEAIENFEDSIQERSHEIKKKHKEVTKYKNNLKDTGVKSVTSGAYIFIENGHELRKKVKNLLEDVVDNKTIRVDRANKTAIGWTLEKEEKEELSEYIDARNAVLSSMETYLERKYSEIEILLNSALSEAKKLEAMDDADFNFSMEHYNVIKKMVEIKVNITKAVVHGVIGFVKSMFEDGIVHGVLNIVGMWPGPVISAVADGANAVLYAAQGDWEAAAWSAAFMIPGTRVGKKIGGTAKNLAAPVASKLFKYGDEAIGAFKGSIDDVLQGVFKNADETLDITGKVENICG